MVGVTGAGTETAMGVGSGVDVGGLAKLWICLGVGG